MREVKTAKGRIINMQALVDANQEIRAVSNVPMNARGDLLDEHGNIKTDKGTITSAYYEDNPKATKIVSIKKSTDRDNTKKVKPKIKKEAEEKEPIVKMDSQPINLEVNKNLKTRKDGSQYWEVEFDDGSMETIEVVKDES